MNSFSASVQLLGSISLFSSSSSVTSARFIIFWIFSSGISAGVMFITSRASSVDTFAMCGSFLKQKRELG